MYKKYILTLVFMIPVLYLYLWMYAFGLVPGPATVSYVLYYFGTGVFQGETPGTLIGELVVLLILGFIAVALVRWSVDKMQRKKEFIFGGLILGVFLVLTKWSPTISSPPGYDLETYTNVFFVLTVPLFFYRTILTLSFLGLVVFAIWAIVNPTSSKRMWWIGIIVGTLSLLFSMTVTNRALFQLF